jgi:hypothetical protein
MPWLLRVESERPNRGGRARNILKDNGLDRRVGSLPVSITGQPGTLSAENGEIIPEDSIRLRAGGYYDAVPGHPQLAIGPALADYPHFRARETGEYALEFASNH